MLNHFDLICFHLLDLSCEGGFFLDNDDWGSEGESELLFNILTAITHWGYTVLKVVPEFVIT